MVVVVPLSRQHTVLVSLRIRYRVAELVVPRCCLHSLTLSFRLTTEEIKSVTLGSSDSPARIVPNYFPNPILRGRIFLQCHLTELIDLSIQKTYI